MRYLLLPIILCLVLVLTASSPMDLRNRPTPVLPSRPLQTEGGGPGFKGITPHPPQLVVRKGEYICGNKICKLTPGVIPKGCIRGLCQYPI